MIGKMYIAHRTLSHMEIIYNLLTFITLIVFIIFIIGLIRPTLLSRFLGKRTNRRFIIIGGLALLFTLGALMSVFEPASAKQARIYREKAVETVKVENKQQSIAENNNIEKKIENPRYYWHKVTRVIDGDTLKASIDGREATIRVIGIDTPESTTKIECYGQESSSKSKELLQGKWIQIERDSSQDNKDKYGRLLRFVWLGNATDFGKQMINEGYAFEYTYNKPYKYQSEYKSSEASTKVSKRGLWASDTCSGQRAKPVPTQSSPAPITAEVRSTVASPPASSPSSNCDPNYSPCVPYVEGNGLNCADIKKKVKVIGVDHNKFDGNGDGYGCESYP
jgi:micrococcal nuclease